MRGRREEPEKQHVAAPHGPNCQCIGCRAERFARRGQAAQTAVNVILKETTMGKARSKKAKKARAVKKTAKRAVKKAAKAPAKRSRYVEVFAGADSQHYYRVKGGNGETLSTSEGYTTKDHALTEARKLGLEVREV